jgi:hypothetical protein
MQVNAQVQSMVYKFLRGFIRNKVQRLIKSGITDEAELFNETLKKAKDNEQFQRQFQQFDIDMDMVKETAKEIIKEELTKVIANPEKKKRFILF